MSRAFENDPRLKHMDPGRLSALQSLAKELEAAPGDQKMAAFLSASHLTWERTPEPMWIGWWIMCAGTGSR